MGPRLCLALLGALLLAAQSGCATSEAKGPREVLRRYIAAIEANRPADAYALLDESIRKQMTPAEFAARWKTVEAELRGRTAQLRAALDKPIKGRAQVSYPSGARAALTYVDNRWQIEEGIAVSVGAATPVDALKSFIRAVEARNYEAVMRLLARPVRESIERDISERMTKLKQALGQEIEVTGNRARIQYDPRFKIELVNEDGEWRVLDLD